MDPVPSAPPQPAPPPEPVTLPKPPIKIWVWILEGVLLLAAGTTGGIFLGKQLYSKPIPSETLVKEGQPSPTPDITANWKTYNNAAANYTVNYPPNLAILKCPNEEDQLYFVTYSQQDPMIALTCARDGRYPLEIIFSKSPITLKDNRYAVSKESINIDNTIGTKYTSSAKPNFEGQGETWFIDVIFSKNGIYYDAYLRDKNLLTTFDQILSTFKFIN